MAAVSLSRVTKRFGATAAVDAIDLEIADGEFLAVLGPSGCGKTTLLRLIAGFEAPDGGEIRLGTRRVADAGHAVPPEERRVGVVFQSYALWPHMDVARNVGYALEVAKMPAAERRVRIDSALALVGLDEHAARRPNELSGGQRQRVALARCLAMSPEVLLLDEPLANLDAHLRASMIEEFRAAHARTGVTTLYITHDQAEAMALATRVAVMDCGRIVQSAAPADLYREPGNAMVGRFIGRGAILPARLLARNGDGHGAIEALGSRARVRVPAAAAAGPVELCLRPEDLAIADGGGDDGMISTRVHRVLYRGGFNELDLAPHADPALRLRMDTRAPVREGETLQVRIVGGWVLPA
jgi:iron(III) transport system ATP-binding protein